MPGQNFVALGSTSWYTSPASASPGLMVEPDGYCPRNARLSSGTSMLSRSAPYSARVSPRVNGLGSKPGVDGVVMMAEKRDILAAHPDGQRRFYAFRGGAYSNCNLFWLTDDRAFKAAGNGTAEPKLDITLGEEPEPAVQELLAPLETDKGDTLIAFGWAPAESLAAVLAKNGR